MLEKLFSRNFISFYKSGKKYLLLNQKIKQKKVINEEFEEFEKKEELEKYIEEIDNPQKYVITFLANENLGVVDSCSKAEYKNKHIEIENIKIVCIHNKYSFYATIYDLVELEKEYKFEIDLIYSVYALIDFKASKKNNLYILLHKEFYALIIYENSIPKYSDIVILIEKEEKEEEIEEIDDLDIMDDLSEDISEEIEDIEDLDLNEAEKSPIEADILNFLKNSLKEYYKIADNFVEQIVIFSDIKIEENFAKIIEDELFIETKIEEFNILKTLNEIGQLDV